MGGMGLGLLSLRNLFLGGFHLGNDSDHSFDEPGLSGGAVSGNLGFDLALGRVWSAQRFGRVDGSGRNVGGAFSGRLGVVSALQKWEKLAGAGIGRGAGCDPGGLAVVHSK